MHIDEVFLIFEPMIRHVHVLGAECSREAAVMEMCLAVYGGPCQGWQKGHREAVPVQDKSPTG